MSTIGQIFSKAGNYFAQSAKELWRGVQADPNGIFEEIDGSYPIRDCLKSSVPSYSKSQGPTQL